MNVNAELEYFIGGKFNIKDDKNEYSLKILDSNNANDVILAEEKSQLSLDKVCEKNVCLGNPVVYEKNKSVKKNDYVKKSFF